MEYEPAKDAFKCAFAPTEIKGHWKDLEGLERVGTTEPKKKKVFRRSESALAWSDRAYRAAAVMALRAQKQKKKDKEDRAELKKTKPNWS